MTELTDDTTTNFSPSDCDNDDYPINRFPLAINQQEHINDEFGLFNNDDDDDDNLTLFDLKPIPRSDHDLSVFDELAHQCNAVLLSTNSQQATLRSNNSSYSSNLPAITMINDYERRFQHSLQKLTIPSWYNDTLPSLKLSKKPPIVSTTHYNQEIHRTPEIVHVHRPHSYRSCRSSLGTSPSPSVHSWHPNHLVDGMNLSSLLPSSSSTSRRSNKYEKGIERVTKSSHWYQPTQFIAAKKSDQINTSKLSTNEQEKSNYNRLKLSNLEKNVTPMKTQIPRISIQRQANCLIDDIDFDDVENTNSIKQNNNYHKGDIPMTYDKQHDNKIPIMPLAKENVSFTRVELEEVTDEEENDKRSTTSNITIPSTVKENDDKTNTSLERLANHLVDSILTDVLLSNNFKHDETNMGVRELSDDENALRELDENDMSGTDEFILFATNAEVSDEENCEQESTNQNDNNQISPTINRGSTNRLYTFSRTNDDGTINNSKKLSSNQDTSTSVLMIVDKDISPTNSHVNQMVDLDNDQSKSSPPIYRSHIQKRQINLGRYYDGMMRAQSSQLPTHDLRCNLVLYQQSKPLVEGVTEETVRKGRILLDQIPNPIELKNQFNENASNIPVRSILKNTRFSSTDEIENKTLDEPIRQIEEREIVSPRKTTTTITEEYHRIQRKIIEEFDGELNEGVYLDSDYLHSEERVTNQQSLTPSVSRTDQSPYELLSECYSGYSFIRNKYSVPLKPPLTSNVSSLQTTTDEAYESETTASPRSPTMSSSTAATTTSPTTHIHPDLEHEFEYPSPPPPVPDRRLKPAHLRPPPPPTKPRYHKQQNDSAVYSKIQKQIKASPLVAIRNLIASTSDNPTFTSIRTLSSRHYCGSIPASNEPLISSSSSSSETRTRTKTTESSQENSKTRSLSSHDNQQIKFRKSSSSSLTKTKSRKSSSTYFDETTNGLAIRLPASQSNEPDSTNKQNPTRSSTSSAKRTDGTTKYRPISENLNPDRSSTYETSV